MAVINLSIHQFFIWFFQSNFTSFHQVCSNKSIHNALRKNQLFNSQIFWLIKSLTLPYWEFYFFNRCLRTYFISQHFKLFSFLFTWQAIFLLKVSFYQLVKRQYIWLFILFRSIKVLVYLILYHLLCRSFVEIINYVHLKC